MAKSFIQNEKAPCRGFSTLAHAGDPTPVNWIDQTIYHFPRPANLFFPLRKSDRAGHSFLAHAAREMTRNQAVPILRQAVAELETSPVTAKLSSEKVGESANIEQAVQESQ